MLRFLTGMMEESNARPVCLLCLFALFVCLFIIAADSFDIFRLISTPASVNV